MTNTVAIIDTNQVPCAALDTIINRVPVWIFAKDPDPSVIEYLQSQVSGAPPSDIELPLSWAEIRTTHDEEFAGLLDEISLHHDTDEENAQLELHGIPRSDAIMAALHGWMYQFIDHG